MTPTIPQHLHADGKDPTTRRRRRRARLSVVASAAMAASVVSAVPAQGTETGNGVTEGHNISVFHNIDMVTTAGWTAGDNLTVTVLRNDVTIGSVTAPAVAGLEGVGLEVNHGPEGAPAPGDCFDGTTPDIRPGDVVRVSDGTVTDEVTVDDLSFGQPAEDGSDVVVPFHAMRADGTQFDATELDAAEYRSPNFDLRANAADDAGSVLVEAVDAATGEFQIRYVAPFDFGRNRDNLTEQQIRDELLGDGHMIGFGHTEPPPGDTQLIEGLTDNPGPAAGCEGSPLAQRAVSSLTPDVLNIANQGSDLTVSGLSQDATEVTVTLTDSAGTTVTSDPVTPEPATGSQTWTATFPTEDLAALTGVITASATFADAAGGTFTGRTKTLIKDMEAPNAPATSLPGDTYLGRQDVSVNAGAEDTVFYNLGDGTQPNPTAATANRYNGQPIAITSSQTLKMVAVDQAGNASNVVTESFTIQAGVTPARPRIRRANARRNGRAVVRWTPPTDNAGPQVTRYRIRAFSRGRRVRTYFAGPNRTRRVVRRLPNGRRYRFTVQARNTVGYGVQSRRSRSVVPRGVPSRPRVRRAFPGSRGGRSTARITWRRPADNGGRRLIGYRVTALQMRNGSVVDRRVSRMRSPQARSHTMRLRRGHYRFRVRAVNRIGRSRLSPRSNRVWGR